MSLKMTLWDFGRYRSIWGERGEKLEESGTKRVGGKEEEGREGEEEVRREGDERRRGRKRKSKKKKTDEDRIGKGIVS